MNALVSVRNNTTGMMTPTRVDRAQVNQKLATTADARLGKARTQKASANIANTGVTNTASRDSEAGDVLGKDDFLQLLVLQMQNQDPMDPTDNSEMLAQLAQFSALEAATNLNDSFEQVSSNIDQLNFMSGSQMLGHYVEGVGLDGELYTGTVNSVHLDGSLVVLNVDGELMSMAGIVRIEDRTPSQQAGPSKPGSTTTDKLQAL